MSVEKKAPAYSVFGKLLTRLRVAAGFAKQQELASALGVRQQSVSRWEKGLARPRMSDVPALERLVGAKTNELLEAAGYQAAADVHAALATSHDRALPLSALSPETFESFCAAFLDRMYRSLGGNVHRYGEAGHKQDGIDIVARGPFGIYSFQCKRVNEFGAQKIHTAVAAQSFAADLKVLLLSSVASPGARNAMASHVGWELWDREDITRRLHDLSLNDRLDLVDRYFSGQRLELLGVDEPSPFQGSEDFFKPFRVPGRFFNHLWTLVGRDDEVSQIVEHVRDKSVILTCLVGPPGTGKSRVLNEVAERLERESALRVRFTSPTEEVKSHHLEGLRDKTNGVTLIVVDDAHEREDLGILLRHAAAPDSRTRLLLSLRPYGKEALRLQAANMSLLKPDVQFVEMQPQTRIEAQALAESVLSQCDSPLEAAVEIARATYTTPLVTVLAAQLVARDAVSLALLGNADEFRTYVLSRLQDVITATLATGQDAQKLRAVLKVVALLQPIIPDDPGLLEILSSAEGIDRSDASRLMRLLGEAGVLFKRGIRSRLAPDLLADEIIHTNYITNGAANESVFQVFEIAGTEHLKNLFVNLGRLDWRLREGMTNDSDLLNGLASKLRWAEKYDNPHVEAVEAVAYYQPRFALNFATRLIAEGHGDSSAVCNMIRNAAYTYDHVQEACYLLWSAGRNDDRPLHQQPSHGIRILKEMAEFKLNKPVEYVRNVVAFALELLEKKPTSIDSAYTPFSILEGALRTDIEARSYSRTSVTFTRYHLPFEEVKSIRHEITESLLNYLQKDPVRRAFLAAQTVAEALRGPMHGDHTTDQVWKQAHVELLQKLQIVLSETHVPAVVLVRLAASVAWHAHYGWPETSTEAQAILKLLNRDLRTRLMRELIDGWGTETWKHSESFERDAQQERRRVLTDELRIAFPDIHVLFDELNACLEEMSSVGRDDYGSPHLLVNYLLSQVPGLAAEVLIRNKQERAGRLAPYVGPALSIAIVTDSNLANDYVSRSEHSNEVLMQIAEAYSRFESRRSYTPQELDLFRRIFESQDPMVLNVASRLARQLAGVSPVLALELICAADFELSWRATHEFFMWIAGGTTFQERDVAIKRRALLEKLVALKKLDDHWVWTFLSTSIKEDPVATVELVKARLMEAKRRNDWSYSPLENHIRGSGLGLLNVEAGPRLLHALLDWALGELTDPSDAYRFGTVISALCGDFDEPFFDLLVTWLSSGSLAKARLIAAILRESQRSIIYEHKFIRDILNVAESIGDGALDDIRSSIAAAAHSGVRSGTVGEPFPEDVRMEEHCVKMLTSLSRVEPTFDLYNQLLKSARYEIARQRKAKEALEDEDDD